MAGLTAFSWGGTLRILTLWVHEDWRRHGYGTQLLTTAEQEALARGCKQVVFGARSLACLPPVMEVGDSLEK
jgi:GNAT superfamily N-acetyltransferase